MIELEPVAFVHAARKTPDDDFWGGTESALTLVDSFDADALLGIDAFSHVEIVYEFHLVDPVRVTRGARHPRGNPDWPRTGIFAQRAKNRPNRIGCSIARVLRLDGKTLHVSGLDAIDGTPVLDIKPVLAEFLPREAVRQPQWTHELMRDYWAQTK